MSISIHLNSWHTELNTHTYTYIYIYGYRFSDPQDVHRFDSGVQRFSTGGLSLYIYGTTMLRLIKIPLFPSAVAAK